MSKPLDAFGKAFVESVRDNGLELLEHTLSGHMKDEESQALHAELSQLSPQAQAVASRLAASVLDTALFDMLEFFESEEEWKLASPMQKIKDLAAISDGLSGELYGENGWIAKYSRYTPGQTDKD